MAAAAINGGCSVWRGGCGLGGGIVGLTTGGWRGVAIELASDLSGNVSVRIVP